VANAQPCVAGIRDALVAVDPARAEAYRIDAAAYTAKLAALDQEISRAIASIPKERRRIVSTHDAFGYFSAHYGLEFIAPQGLPTEAEASARDIARIIHAIKQHKAAAVSSRTSRTHISLRALRRGPERRSAARFILTRSLMRGGRRQPISR
jgi:zinc/manganese transport system substrate-binding protein